MRKGESKSSVAQLSDTMRSKNTHGNLRKTKFCTFAKNIYGNDILLVPKSHMCGRRTIYTCSVCEYETNRLHNVLRHQRRIHCIAKKPRICCGELYLTKGEYYFHCEQKHPGTRVHNVTSRTKYKIVSDKLRRAVHFYNEQKFFKSSRNETKTKITYECRMSYSKLAVEEQKINSDNKDQDSNHNLDDLMFPPLPPKKLFLYRFMIVTRFKTETSQIKKDDSIGIILNEKSNYENKLKIKKRSKKCKKHFHSKRNRENIPPGNLEEKVKIRIAENMKQPLVTRLHREFLSSINFENFRVL